MLFTVLIEFDKEAISDDRRSENYGIVGGFCILSDFRGLSFCGPYGPRLLPLHWSKSSLDASCPMADPFIFIFLIEFLAFDESRHSLYLDMVWDEIRIIIFYGN